VLTLICGFAAINAGAQPADYPQRAVTFLCPFPAGGGTDILTRLLAQELQEKLKRPVIVENRPGAGTIVAAQAAARAAPDGHTILLAPVTRWRSAQAFTSRCRMTRRATSRRSGSSDPRNLP